MVPKGLLTFLGSLYKEGAKTTPGTMVCRFERQTARKKVYFFQKHCVLDLECRFYLRNPQIASFWILMSYFVESKLKKIPPLVTSKCENWFPLFFATVGLAIEVDTII